MHELRINNTHITYPGSWDELTEKQLLAIASLSSLQLSEMQFKFHCFTALTKIEIPKQFPSRNPDNINEKLFRIRLIDKSEAMISSMQLTELANSMDFLISRAEKKDGIHVSLESKLTRNIISFFKIDGLKYYGPADKLFNITFSEFIHTETNLKRFMNSRDVVFLDKLIAILYRKQARDYDPDSKDFNGDRREPFNDHQIDARAAVISKMDHNIKIAIYLFYTGCQNWIMNQFPHVFQGTGKRSDDSLGFLGLVDTLTGGDVTKNELVRSSYLMDVMVHLEKSAIDYEKMKKDLKMH